MATFKVKVNPHVADYLAGTKHKPPSRARGENTAASRTGRKFPAPINPRVQAGLASRKSPPPRVRGEAARIPVAPVTRGAARSSGRALDRIGKRASKVGYPR